jgi:O-antigen ligase
LLLTSLFFTFSRGAWVALLVGIIFLIAILLLTKKIFEQKGLFMILLSGGVLLFVLFGLYGDLAFTRFTGDGRLEVKSYEERVSAYGDFRKIIKNNWLIGTGIGNYGLELNKADPGRPAWRYQPVHNAFFLIWGEVGVVGLLGYLGLLGCLGYYLFINTKYHELAILESILILMLVDHWLWSLHFGVLLFWFVLGVISIKDQEKSRLLSYLQNLKNKL